MHKLITLLDADFNRWLVKYPVGVLLIIAGFVLDLVIAIPFAPICWWEGRQQQRKDRPQTSEVESPRSAGRDPAPEA